MTTEQRALLLTFYAACCAVAVVVDARSEVGRAVTQCICSLERSLDLPRTHQSRAERRSLT